MGYRSGSSYGPGLVEYFLILTVVAVIVIAVLTILKPVLDPFFEGAREDSRVSESVPTIRLVCHQGGQRVVDVQTDDGWTFGDIEPGESYRLGWRWTVRGEEHTLLKFEDTKCEHIPLFP